MAVVLKVDNVDKSNLIDFESLGVNNNLYSKPDSCFFIYEKYGSRTYVPAGGDEIGVWDGATQIFGGKIINVKVKISGKVLVYDVECKDWTDQLDGELVAETYESKTVNEIITDLQGKYATTFDISNVSCATNIEAIYFNMKPLSKCLDDLAEIAGYHWFVSPEKKIYFFVEGSLSSPFDITDTNGYCIDQSLEIEGDYEQIKNRINIKGGNISTIQVHDAPSIATYGEHEVLIRDNTLTSIAEATQKANAILAAYKDLIKKGEFSTYEAGLIAGQKINVNSTLRAINQDFIIQSIKFTMMTPSSFVYDVVVMTQQEKNIIDLLQQEIIETPPATITNFGDQNYSCDVAFSIIDYQNISWAAGSIKMSNGDSYSIALGNHTIGGSTEICYFDPSVSTTVLQFSAAFADGVGSGKTALGYAVPNPNNALGAQFIPKGFMGGVRFWGGENIVARTIIADQIGLHALTSDLVTAGEFITSSAQIKNAIITNAKISGTLTVSHTDAKCTDPDADQTSANPQPSTWLSSNVEKAKLGTTVMTGGYMRTDMLNTTVVYVSQSAMIANAIINDAHINNLTVEKLTGTYLTGKVVRTSSGTTRVEMNATNNALYVYESGDKTIEISSNTIAFYYQGDSRGSIHGISSNGIRLFGYNTAETYFAAVDIVATAASTGALLPCWGHTIDLGTTTYPFQKLYVDEIELNGVSKTSWPSGAGSLSALTIDANKSWGNYDITNMGSITCGASTETLDYNIGKMRIPVGTNRY